MEKVRKRNENRANKDKIVKSGRSNEECKGSSFGGGAEGTRMKSILSKLIHRVYYQSLVKSPAKACIESGIGETIVVVGHQADKVRAILGEEFTYVYQKKRLGTGDALRQAIPLLRGFKGELVVLPGDALFVSSSVIIGLVQAHILSKMSNFFFSSNKKSDKMLPPLKLNSFPVKVFLKSRFVFCHLINFI